MKKAFPGYAIVLISVFLLSIQVCPQKEGINYIDIPDLETHMSILASDEMEGRATGEPGLDKAAEYLAKQAREMGLKAIDENNDYYQEYTLVNKQLDRNSSYITISHEDETETSFDRLFYVMNPDSDRMELSGEVVFAGYGIISKNDNYDDFRGLDLEDKIVLIMTRGPLDKTAEENLLSGQNWKNMRSFRYKIPGLVKRGAKAVLIVMDPKSGHNSLAESAPGMARYMGKSRYVKELGNERRNSMPHMSARIIIIHREVADEILKPGGKSLAKLQESIDRKLKPASFELPGTTVKIQANYSLIEKPVPNVAGLIEGSDPELKKEVILYTAHFDHLGTSENGGIYNGADDNASGTVALIEIGEAFMAEKEKLKRSVMILWVSGEEIGLYGSQYYTENPLIPLDQTIASLNLDMVGTVRTERDTGMIHGEMVSVMGMDTISLIGGHQSTELMDIHNEVMDELGMHTDSSLNDPDHPYRYYYRSDHINFARHNIPVLFYSTGVHPDYHQVTDDIDRINFEKMKKVCELSFLVGYELATRPERIIVDNPFSNWGRMRR